MPVSHWKRLLVLGLALATFALSSPAKRAPSQLPAPIRYGDYEFRATDQPQTMGLVEIWSIHTNTKLCDVRMYHVPLNPLVEQDTQWIFIKSMSLQWPVLTVVDERGKTFRRNVEKDITAAEIRANQP